MTVTAPRFAYRNHNMDFTEKLLHRPIPETTIAKIALFVSVLFASFLEGLFKNGVLLIANTGIFLANHTYQFLQKIYKKIS